MDKFAEFVCWTLRMLYETKTQNAGKFAYFVSHGAAFRSRRLHNVPVVNPTIYFAGSGAIVK